jgi:preprotein translocase subunit SecF
MGGLGSALTAFLKQVLWALVLVYLILLCAAYLFGKQVGFELSFLACLGIALLVTATFVSIYLCNVIWIVVEEAVKRRIHRRAKK